MQRLFGAWLDHRLTTKYNKPRTTSRQVGGGAPRVVHSWVEVEQQAKVALVNSRSAELRLSTLGEARHAVARADSTSVNIIPSQPQPPTLARASPRTAPTPGCSPPHCTASKAASPALGAAPICKPPRTAPTGMPSRHMQADALSFSEESPFRRRYLCRSELLESLVPLPDFGKSACLERLSTGGHLTQDQTSETTLKSLQPLRASQTPCNASSYLPVHDWTQAGKNRDWVSLLHPEQSRTAFNVKACQP